MRNARRVFGKKRKAKVAAHKMREWGFGKLDKAAYRVFMGHLWATNMERRENGVGGFFRVTG